MVLSSFASISIFQMPQVVEYLLFVESTFRFHTTQHSKQMLSPYVFSSEGWGILAWGLFSQSNSPSYFMTTSTVFGHQTSEVTKLFHSFQILSIDCDLHSSSFHRRHSHDFSFLRIDFHVVLLWCILQCIHNNLHRFWDIQRRIMECPWNLGYGSFKVIENGTIR